MVAALNVNVSLVIALQYPYPSSTRGPSTFVPCTARVTTAGLTSREFSRGPENMRLVGRVARCSALLAPVSPSQFSPIHSVTAQKCFLDTVYERVFNPNDFRVAKLNLLFRPLIG